MSKSLIQCEKVFLDTTFILHLLNTDSTDSTVELVRKIRNALSNKKLNIRYFVSTVSLIEIAGLKNPKLQNDVIIESIMDTLNGKDIEIIPFSEDIALHFRKIFKDFFAENIQKEFIRTHLPKSGNFKNSREWISKDMMIAATAHYMNADVIFSNDESTFLPVTKMIGVNCVITKEENFQFSQGGNLVYDFA